MSVVRRRLLRCLVPGTLLLLLLGGFPFVAASQHAAPQPRKTVKPTVKRVIQRSGAVGESRTDRTRDDDARATAGAHDETALPEVDPEQERLELERIQEAQAGTHGRSCIYGANGEVLHQPQGAVCDRPPGPRRPDAR